LPSKAPALPVSKFSGGAVDTGDAPWIVNTPGFLEKIWNGTKVIFRSLGEDDSWKKT
jgi:hypothetical protein